MKVDEICRAIMDSTLNQDDLNVLARTFNAKRARILVAVANSFRLGQKVQFRGRNGGTVVGRLVKINRKTSKVMADSTGAMWCVTNSLLTVA